MWISVGKDGSLPIELSEIGQWWGQTRRRKKQIQIDIVGTPVEGKDYIIGSCKYRNEKIGVDELDLIRDYASVLERATTITTISSRKADSQMGFSYACEEVVTQIASRIRASPLKSAAIPQSSQSTGKCKQVNQGDAVRTEGCQQTPETGPLQWEAWTISLRTAVGAARIIMRIVLSNL